jgi:hypothetical protein
MLYPVETDIGDKDRDSDDRERSLLALRCERVRHVQSEAAVDDTEEDHEAPEPDVHVTPERTLPDSFEGDVVKLAERCLHQ